MMSGQQLGGASRPQPGTVVSLPVILERQDVVRFVGYPEGRDPPERVASLLEATLARARRLVRARGVFVLLPADSALDLGLERIDAGGLVVGLVTIGDALEQRST